MDNRGVGMDLRDGVRLAQEWRRRWKGGGDMGEVLRDYSEVWGFLVLGAGGSKQEGHTGGRRRKSDKGMGEGYGDMFGG